MPDPSATYGLAKKAKNAIRALLTIAVLSMVLVGCKSNGSKPAATDTPVIATVTQTIDATPRLSADERALAAEADSDPSLPGEYIDLPAIYGAPYPFGPPPPHQDGPIDYSAQGLPPAGGLHWGPSTGWAGPCPEDPATAPLNCGPVPWGVYRSPWHAESLVHNMEHAGIVIWYNTTDQAVIDDLEAFATQQFKSSKQLVLAPYPDMEAETIGITVWSRRDKFAVGEYNPERLQKFIDALYCRFDPEGFC